MDTGKILLLIALVGLGIFIYLRLRAKFKSINCGNLTLVSGGVKCGKTTLSVYLAVQQYRRNHRSWKIRSFFCKLFGKAIPEEPMLYSNIPLSNVPYCPVLKEHLRREVRFNYGSVIYICEASLVADSQLIKDMDLNDRLLLFNKLIAHETKGGSLYYDTQSVSDVHYTIKRSLSSYVYVERTVRWIPFFLIAYVREDRYSEDGSVMSNYDSDIEDSLKKFVMLKKRAWIFDPYCYSSLTDELPVCNSKIKLSKFDSLKANQIVSFRESRFKDENKFPDMTEFIHKKKKEEVVEDEKKND